MLGRLKLSLLVLTGVAMTLSACTEIGDRSVQTPQNNTSSASPSPARQASQTLSQNSIQAKSTATGAETAREDYKPVSLEEIGDTKPLVGNDPKAVAVSAFGNIESEGGSQDVTVDYPQPDRAIVIITQTGVADDSVGGMRFRVELQQNSSASSGKRWEVVWAGSQVKCHPGRGHQDWSTKLCL